MSRLQWALVAGAITLGYVVVALLKSPVRPRSCGRDNLHPSFLKLSPIQGIKRSVGVVMRRCHVRVVPRLTSHEQQLLALAVEAQMPRG